MFDKFKIYLLYFLPHHFCARMMGYLVRCRWVFLKNYLIHLFINHYQVDLSQAIREKAQDYESFQDFFIRELKPDARKINQDKSKIVSPVDGGVSEFGDITDGKLIQAKGKTFTLESLLADENNAQTFHNGKFITLYLAPKDYHRVHMPCDGNLVQSTYIPGRLFSVNPLSTQIVDNLFAKNERLVHMLDTGFGPMALIMVGAFYVGNITTVYSGTVTPPRTPSITHTHFEPEPLHFKKGEELAYFTLGSTVILLFSENTANWDSEIKQEAEVILGKSIAQFI